jgi:2,3-bisphosphoglycerate-dependent phosphoglycerate mutase
MFHRILITLLLTLFVAATAAAQQTVFLVRHAERADTATGGRPMMASDPDLSDAGRTRAASLATMLADAGITAIYTTEFKRTQQTAAPLAKLLGISPTVVKSTDAAALVKDIRSQKGNVLVVGHSNTIPDIVKSLGIDSSVTIGDDDFDNLFVVTAAARPTLVRLHYR